MCSGVLRSGLLADPLLSQILEVVSDEPLCGGGHVILFRVQSLVCGDIGLPQSVLFVTELHLDISLHILK